MKLHYSRASPFVRKVLVLAHETGLISRIELIEAAVSPVSPNAAVNADNPLGKVPALVPDSAHALYDSRVICEYLDAQHDGPKMFPAAGSARWTALRRQALADGILDAGVLTRYEAALRPEEHRWDDWVSGQRAKMARALDALEQEAETMGDQVDIGAIGVGCALGYLDFRFAADDWRRNRPKLDVWYRTFAIRPSMQATGPE